MKQRKQRYTPQSKPRQKQVGPAGNKIVVSAQRPTLQAGARQWEWWNLPRSLSRNPDLVKMLKQARDTNPDVSKALENIVSLANPGYELNVFQAGVKDAEGKPVPDPEGLDMVRQFATYMLSEYSGAWDELAGQGNEYAGLNTLIDMTNLSLFTYGAASFEVELTKTLDDVVDVYPVNPCIVDFQRDPESKRWTPGLSRWGKFIPLDPIRFRYVPKTPDVDDPFGRSPLLAIIDTVIFQQEFMRELKSIVHMVNTPRLDIKVMQEAALTALERTRPDLFTPGKEQELEDYIAGYLTAIQGVIEELKPDDAFVHTDSVEAQFISPNGTAIPIKDVMAAIDTMMVSATKQLPLLLGRNEGATTTHATVQWQVYIEQLKMYQRICKAIVTWALNLYLRVKGRTSYVDFTFNEHKTSDDLVDAQALNFRVTAWKTMQSQGWASGDEAALKLLGHEAVGEPAPEPSPFGGAAFGGGRAEGFKPNGIPMPAQMATHVNGFSQGEIARLGREFEGLPSLSEMRDKYGGDGDA
jgi:hypothetical protein